MKLFGEYLVEKNIITASQLVAALVKQNAMLPSVAEVVLEKKLIEPVKILEIFKIQHEKKTGFIEAAKELNVWSNDMHLSVEKHIGSLRMPLGQILVEMTSVPLESITHALDDFLAEMKTPAEPTAKSPAITPVTAPAPAPTPSVAPVASTSDATPTEVSAEIVDYSHFCEVLNQERKQTLLSSIALMKAGDVSLSPLQTAKDILHILKGAARFASVTQCETLITSMESVISLILNAPVGKINPETTVKVGDICQKGTELLWELSDNLALGVLESEILKQPNTKKAYDATFSSLELIRFDLELL